nr:MAG TPA: hypothetical protein [Caudoviricetes sp.]
MTKMCSDTRMQLTNIMIICIAHISILNKV